MDTKIVATLARTPNILLANCPPKKDPHLTTPGEGPEQGPEKNIASTHVFFILR